MADFYSLGMADLFPITATQGRGVSNMLARVLKDFSDEDETSTEAVAAKGIKIAIAGRPNVGKSTLVNRMLGEDRVVVFDQPGTTRDSVLYSLRASRRTLYPDRHCGYQKARQDQRDRGEIFSS